jgi:hypothetical protein
MKAYRAPAWVYAVNIAGITFSLAVILFLIMGGY